MEPSISSDLIRGHIDTIILKSLKDGDKHVQQIIDYVESKSNGSYSLNQATLYSSLKRLESNGFILSFWHNSDDGRRKFFKITSSGLASVNENLSNWTYSRSVIDKLMDVEPTTVSEKVATQDFNNASKDNLVQEEPVEADNENENDDNTVIEKFNTVNLTPSIQQYSLFADKNNDKRVEKIESDIKPEIANENPVQNKTTDAVKTEKPVNFRQVLNGLIESTKPVKVEIKDERQEEVLTPINKEAPVEVAKFNKTISESNYTAQVSNNTTKIDFTDLSLKATKDGYKLRISAKDSAKPKGIIYSNKLRFYSSLIMMIICALEAVILSSTVSGIADTAFILLSCVIVLAYPVVSTLIYIKTPRKTTGKKEFASGITTSAIVIFNAIIITTALNIVLDADFKNTLNISRSFIIPVLLCIDVFLYFVVKTVLSKTNAVKTKIKKA